MPDDAGIDNNDPKTNILSRRMSIINTMMVHAEWYRFFVGGQRIDIIIAGK